MRLVLLVVVTCLCAVGCDAPPPVTSSGIGRTPVPVQTVVLQEEKVARTTTQPASVLPYFEARIRPKVTGYAETPNVDVGDFVEAGATLLTISIPEYDKQQEILAARLERAKAEETRASAGVELAKAGVTSAEAKLHQAQAEAQKSNAVLAALDAEFTRANDLVQRQSLEPRLLDEVRKRRDGEIANRTAAESAVASAEAEVTVAMAQHTSAQADLTAAQADTSIAQKQVEEMEVLVGYRTLKAAFDGVVTQRTVNPGDLVRDNGEGQPLFVLSQVSKLRIQVHVPERDAPFVTRGDQLALTLPGFPGEEFTTTVLRVAQNLDAATRTMLVEAELENPEGKLLPGMFGQAVIKLTDNAVAHMLPSRAVRFDANGQAFVYVISSDDKVTKTSVKTGRDTGVSIEIVEGLTAGTVVVDHHLKRFQDGEEIHRLN